MILVQAVIIERFCAAHIKAEAEACRVVLIMQRVAVGIKQPFGNEQVAQGILIDMVVEINHLALADDLRHAGEIGKIRADRRAGRGHVVDGNRVVDGCVKIAFPDKVFRCVIREADIRHLPRRQEEHIVISLPAALIFHRRTRAFIGDGRHAGVLIAYLAALARNLRARYGSPLAVFRVVVPDLIAEVGAGVILFVGAADRLFEQQLAVGRRGQIEAHMQVGHTRAALHIQHFHGMGGKVLEYRAAGAVLVEDPVEVSLHVIIGRFRMPSAIVFFKELAQRYCSHKCRISADKIGPSQGILLVFNPCYLFIRWVFYGNRDDARTEVDGSRQRGVDTAEVKHPYAVHIQPHIVVAGKLKDNIVAPVVETIRRLDESCFHLHTEEVLRFRKRNGQQRFTVAGIIQ